MRVLQLGPIPPPHGGVAGNLVAIHRALLDRGVDAHAVNITGTRRTSTDRVQYPANAGQLLGILLRSRPDIVHIHIGGRISTRLLALCLVCAKLPGARSVVTVHSGGFAHSAASGKRIGRFSLASIVFRGFDRVIVVNDQMLGVFAWLGVSRPKLRLIPPYSNRSASAGADDVAACLPDAMENFFASHSPVLLTVGALESEYDLDFQFEMLPQVAQRFPEVGLVVIGGGSQYQSTLDSVSRTGMSDRVLVCGDVPHDITLRVIQRAAAVLRTTKYDGDSITIREALAAGRPVVATDNGMRPPGTELFELSDRRGFMDALSRALAAGRPSVPLADAYGGAEAVVDVYGELRPLASGP